MLSSYWHFFVKPIWFKTTQLIISYILVLRSACYVHILTLSICYFKCYFKICKQWMQFSSWEKQKSRPTWIILIFKNIVMLPNHCQYTDYFSTHTVGRKTGKLCSNKEGQERWVHRNDKQTQVLWKSNNFIVVSNLEENKMVNE